MGSSAPGAPLLAQTNGGKPLRPHISHLLEPGPTNITVHLRAWNDNGCPPLLGFDIQYREMGHKVSSIYFLIINSNIDSLTLTFRKQENNNLFNFNTY